MKAEDLINEIDMMLGNECDKKCSECIGCPVKDIFDEVKRALEKQIPIAPYRIGKLDYNDNADVICPSCKCANNTSVKSIKHICCWKCGQALKWG